MAARSWPRRDARSRAAGGALGAEPKYGAVRDFLVAHTKVVELTGEQRPAGGHLPRVSRPGHDIDRRPILEGRSLGWVNKAFIEKGDKDPHFNNYGGEDRLWLAPEGGPYSLWFARRHGPDPGQLVHAAGAQRRRVSDRLRQGRALLPPEPADENQNAGQDAVRSGNHARNPPAKAASLRQTVRQRGAGRRLGLGRLRDGRLSDDQYDHQSRRGDDRKTAG